MSDKIVTVGIWTGAPFGGSILRGIEKLNLFLKSENLDVRYEPERIDDRSLPKPGKTPDILILDGGEDVNPEMYGQKNTHSSFNDARDAAEMGLLTHFINYGKRISGICRGHQLINVYFGGSLIQDIRSSRKFSETSLDLHKGGHKVKLKRPLRVMSLYKSKYKSNKSTGVISSSGSGRKRGHIISRFVGENPFTVSSMHHQSVKGLGDGLGVSLSFGNTKRDAYYIVEGIESSNGSIRGIQSHPEFDGYPKDGVMFSYLMHIDTFVDNLFEPNMEEVKKRLEAEKGAAPNKLPFDMQNIPPEPMREPPRRNVRNNVGDTVIRQRADTPQIAQPFTTNFTVTTTAPPLTWEDDNGTAG